MCFGCIASSDYWDAADKDQSLVVSEEQGRSSTDALRARLRAGLVRLEEDLAADTSTAVTPQR